MINWKVVPHERGFTILEIVIVLAVVSILTTLSFVVYTHFLKKARMVEAKTILSDLSKHEEAYYVANEKYTTNLKELGLPTLGNTKFYTYTIAVPDPTAGSDPISFLATATGNIDNDPALDVWTIDKDKNLTHTVED